MRELTLFFIVLPAVAAQNQASLQLSVEQISTPTPWLFWIAVLALFAAFVAVVFLWHRIVRSKPPLSGEPIRISGEPIAIKSVRSREVEAEKYLKEDERIVLRALKFKEGSAEQGTLRVVTNFSKAKLSRILAELEQRGIIHKEQRGRKNIVTLRIPL